MMLLNIEQMNSRNAFTAGKASRLSIDTVMYAMVVLRNTQELFIDEMEAYRSFSADKNGGI